MPRLMRHPYILPVNYTALAATLLNDPGDRLQVNPLTRFIEHGYPEPDLCSRGKSFKRVPALEGGFTNPGAVWR